MVRFIPDRGHVVEVQNTINLKLLAIGILSLIGALACGFVGSLACLKAYYPGFECNFGGFFGWTMTIFCTTFAGLWLAIKPTQNETTPLWVQTVNYVGPLIPGCFCFLMQINAEWGLYVMQLLQNYIQEQIEGNQIIKLIQSYANSPGAIAGGENEAQGVVEEPEENEPEIQMLEQQQNVPMIEDAQEERRMQLRPRPNARDNGQELERMQLRPRRRGRP